MAVAFDAVGPSSAGASSTASTTVSWSHTCAGANRCLFVGVAVGVTPDTGVTATATYGGVAMTSAGLVHSNNSNAGWVQLFYLTGPATGANTVVVTTSAGTSTLAAGSVSFTGVHPTTPIGTPATAFGAATPATVNIAASTAGNMIVDAVCCGNPVLSSNQTNRWIRNVATSTGAGNGAQSTAAAGGSVTMTYTVTTDWWGLIAVEVRAAVGVTQRAAVGGTSTASITSIATSFPAGTTTGDLVYILVTTNTRAAAPVAAGWTPVLGGDATTTMGAIVCWRTIQAGDVAPTVSWTTASTRTAWVAITLAPSAPGMVAAHVDFAAVLAGTTTATSRTPSSYAAGALSGASVLLTASKGSATGTTNIATTPPTNWTEPANGDQGTVLATAQQAAASCSYRLAQTGTIAPGAETVAVTAFAYVYHAFAIEAPGQAARFQLVTDALFNTAGLPAVAPFTVCCWAKLMVDRNTWSTIWTIDNSSALSFAAETAVDGTMLNLWHGGTERNIQQLVVGTWYKLAYVVSGTTATVYVAAEGAGLASFAGGAYAAFTPTTFDIGNMRRNGEFLNGAVAAMKLWDAALNTTELAAEFTQYDPVRTANLNRYYSFFTGPAVTDGGPNGRTLTAGSTAATATAGPNIPRTAAAAAVLPPIRPALLRQAVSRAANW